MVKSTLKAAALIACAMPGLAMAGNLAVTCGKFNIKIYPNAIFLNGDKTDNASKQTESDIMSYVFEQHAEMGGNVHPIFVGHSFAW